MRRVAFSAALLLLALLVQLSVFGNLRLPGGAGPDLVLVVVVALALTGGPVEGMLGGFFAGLALDVAPPATHLVGQYALVFCVVGYAVGRLGSKLDESAWVPLAVVAVGSAVGELLFALTGMIFGNLDITWSTIGHVLPASVVYDVLLSPFVLYAVVRARALAAPALTVQGLAAFPGGSAGQPLAVPGLAGAAALFGGSGTVLRDSGTGRAPRLKARTLRAGSTQGGSASGSRPALTRPARPVHLKFGGGGGGSARPAGAAAAARARQGLPSRPVNLHLGKRRRSSQDRGSRPGGARSQGSWQRGGGIPAKAFSQNRASRPGGARSQGSWQRGGGIPAKAFSQNRASRPGGARPRGSWQRGGGIPAKAFSQNRASRPGGARSQGSWQRGGGIPAKAFSRAGGGRGDGAGGRALRPSRGPRLRGGVMQGGSASGARAVRLGARPARPVHLRLGSAARRRDGAIGGSVLGRRARGTRLRAGKLHAPRFRGSKPGALSGRRAPARALNGRRTFGRRRSSWRIFGKRSGGLSR